MQVVREARVISILQSTKQNIKIAQFQISPACTGIKGSISSTVLRSFFAQKKFEAFFGDWRTAHRFGEV
jgi:hypothetical protein